MPAKSQAQQQAAGAALAAKRGEMPKSELWGAAKQMAKMKTGDLRKFAKTKHTGLPAKKEEALAQIGRSIVTTLLAEDEPGEERQEILLARNILSGLRRLQGSMPNPTPEQQHALTSIRAATQSLMRMHGAM